MKLAHLRTLHQENPLGIDKNPYFSWHMISEKKDTTQVSWKICVVKENGECVWDSGKNYDRRQSFIPYRGNKLESSSLYQWCVTVEDNHGEEYTASGYFETALLQESDWKAQWIESLYHRVKPEKYLYGNQPPALWFEKIFSVEKKIKSARLYATSYGCYHVYINGKKADEREFAPEHTVYRDILYYQTMDITSVLKNGNNTCSLHVGDGWFHCPQSKPIMSEGTDISSLAVLFQIEIRYEDGTSDIICSDGTEKSHTGSVVFSDLFRGEKQDARRKPEYFDVKIKNYGYKQLKAQAMPPVLPVKTLAAEKVYISPKGEVIVDFGQLLAGRARINLNEPKDREVSFEYFECPDKEGNYFNSMYADQKDIYISDGNPCEYEAKFTFHGFRYLRVTGMSHPKKEDFTAVHLTTWKENTGDFECSDERLNRLYKNIRWSQSNNMMSIPTDCPSREKAGFTGDIQIYARTAMLNEDMIPFLESWLDNLSADQTEKGVLPIVTPLNHGYRNLVIAAGKAFGDEEMEGVAGWSDAAVLVPWQIYRISGNEEILKRHYGMMKRWCDYIIRTSANKRGALDLSEETDQYLWNTGFHFGEWLIPSQEQQPGFGECVLSSWYTAPMFGYYSMKIFADIGKILNKDEYKEYKFIAEKMKDAIQKSIIGDGYIRMKEKNSSYKDCFHEFMGAYVLAIAFDLLTEKQLPVAAERLVSLLEENDFCLDTGFLATPYLLDSLDKIGRKDLAIQLLWQEKMPSWLFEVNHGATAIWESWSSMDAEYNPTITSYDHYAFGCVDEWIFRNIAGIQEIEPGFSHFRIAPDPSLPLSWCKRSFICEHGEIYVLWNKEELRVKIPCNTTAEIEWKGKVYELGSGEYVVC